MSWKFENSFAALRHRNFRMFVTGQFISLIGFWMQSVGLSWLVYRLTHSSFYLGAIAFAQQIPILLFAFAAGGMVDRTNRRRLVILTQSLALVQATILWYLTQFGIITIPHLFVLAVFTGLISAVDLPARQAFLIQMVSKEDLMNAIAINSSMFNGARMIGPAIAGYVVAHWGEATCFLANAVSYVAVLISLIAMRINITPDTARQKSLASDIAEGFRFIREALPVRMLLQLIGVLGMLGFPYVVLLPVFADKIFARGASGLGWLMTGVGIGALMGALFLAGRKGLRGISRLISISSIAFSVSLIFFALSPYFWLSFSLLVCTGFFMMITVASVNTLIQAMIPDELRGRVMSLFTTMLIGTAPVGSLLAGWLARYLGVRSTILILASFCMGAGLWFYRSVPRIVVEARRLHRLYNPAPVEETIAGSR